VVIALARRAPPVAQPRKLNIIFEEIYNSKCGFCPMSFSKHLTATTHQKRKTLNN